MSSVPWALQLLFLAALIFLCGWLISTLTAFTQLNEPQLRDKAEAGDAEARRLCRLLDRKEQTESGLVTALTMSCLLCGAFSALSFRRSVFELLQAMGVPMLSRAARWGWSLALALVICVLLLALGYSVPSRIADRHPEQTMRRRLAGVRVLLGAVYPLSWLMRKVSDGMLRLSGLNPEEQPEEVTEEEIRAMVDIGEETGAIETAEREMIENIFEFNNRSAEDVMTHRTDVELLWIDDDRDAILEAIRRTGLSRFPVCEKDIDDVVGILSTRDYLMELQQPEPRPLRALLREPYFVPGTLQADELFRTMQRRKQHMAVVTDEYGGVSGIITMEDLLEEIVGNIYDEFDPLDETGIQKLQDGVWRISGTVPLEEVSEALQVPLPLDEDYDTLGGLIFSRLTMIPGDGETPEVDAFGLHIRVERIHEHRVENAVVTLLPPQTELTNEEKRNDHE